MFIRALLEQLAHELAEQADDVRAPAEAAGWLIAAFGATVDRLGHCFDRDAVKAAAAVILGRIAARRPEAGAKDLFLVYVPEDRLPVAAPLAVELAKRRVSVALADYEVAIEAEFMGSIRRGLSAHRGGIVLWTLAFTRHGWPEPVEHSRIRIVREFELTSLAADLTTWARRLAHPDGVYSSRPSARNVGAVNTFGAVTVSKIGISLASGQDTSRNCPCRAVRYSCAWRRDAGGEKCRRNGDVRT